MQTNQDTARRFAAVVHLYEKTRLVADQIVTRAHAAQERGGTAEAYRTGAQELDQQADRAEKLLFGQALKTLRAAADECRLVADALEVLEAGSDA